MKIETLAWSPDEHRLREQLEVDRTVVLNCRKGGPHANIVEWAEAVGLAVYIGRENTRARPSRRRSAWANPFKPGVNGTREQVCELYREYLLGQRDPPPGWRAPRPSLDQFQELRGRALLCWCAPLACHGDILQALITERLGV